MIMTKKRSLICDIMANLATEVWIFVLNRIVCEVVAILCFSKYVAPFAASCLVSESISN